MAITNTHEIDIISQIRLPDGKTYEIHDPNAIHDVADLNLSSVFKYKGAVESYQDLPATAEIGDVYHILSTGKEYVWVSKDNLSEWEVLGATYDAASSTHTHDVTVSGTNKASKVTGTVVVPTITAEKKYLTATVNSPTVTPTKGKVLGANTKFTTTVNHETKELIAEVTGVVIDTSGEVQAITGFGTHTTAKAITELNTASINNPTVTAGTAAKLEPTVVNGVLSFGFTANTPTVVTTTPATVVTGSKATANAITALGTPTTKNVPTGVDVKTQPTVKLKTVVQGDVSVLTGISNIQIIASGDEVDALTGVTVGSSSVSLDTSATEIANSTGIVTGVTIGTANSSIVNGSAAAQEWSQSSGTTGQPK